MQAQFGEAAAAVQHTMLAAAGPQLHPDIGQAQLLQLPARQLSTVNPQDTQNETGDMLSVFLQPPQAPLRSACPGA